MHQPRKAPVALGMKAHIGVDADSGLVHTVIDTTVNLSDLTQVEGSLNAKEKHVSAMLASDAYTSIRGYKGEGLVHVATRPGERRALDHERELHQLMDKAERLRASVRAKVEHPFLRIVGSSLSTPRYATRARRGHCARINTLFALSCLWMAQETHPGPERRGCIRGVPKWRHKG